MFVVVDLTKMHPRTFLGPSGAPWKLGRTPGWVLHHGAKPDFFGNTAFLGWGNCSGWISLFGLQRAEGRGGGKPWLVLWNEAALGCTCGAHRQKRGEGPILLKPSLAAWVQFAA